MRVRVGVCIFAVVSVLSEQRTGMKAEKVGR